MKKKPTLSALKKRGKPIASMEQYSARFWSRVDKSGSCWLWTRACNTAGYGVFRMGKAPGKIHFAHRFSYELVKGPIPEGLHLDHLCRTPRCVNPDHLEAVTPKENWRRGISPSAQRAKQTHCVNGHELSGDNLYLRPDTGTRQCLKCKHDYFGRWYEEKKKTKDPAFLKSRGLAIVQ